MVFCLAPYRSISQWRVQNVPPRLSLFRINVRLSGQHKCHTPFMENVTLTQKEQARLQVLNSLLAEHMALDQAATLMGVTTRHTRRILAAYRNWALPPLPTVIVAAGHPTQHPSPLQLPWFTWLVPGTPGPTTPIYQSCSVNARASTWAGPPCGASWSTPGSAVRGEGVRPSTGYAASACPGRAC